MRPQPYCEQRDPSPRAGPASFAVGWRPGTLKGPSMAHRIALLLLAATALAGPAQAQGRKAAEPAFCSRLKTVLAAADDQFIGVKGQSSNDARLVLSDKAYDLGVYYEAKVVFPGAKCRVYE